MLVRPMSYNSFIPITKVRLCKTRLVDRRTFVLQVGMANLTKFPALDQFRFFHMVFPV